MSESEVYTRESFIDEAFDVIKVFLEQLDQLDNEAQVDQTTLLITDINKDFKYHRKMIYYLHYSESQTYQTTLLISDIRKAFIICSMVFILFNSGPDWVARAPWDCSCQLYHPARVSEEYF